eukprot:COSAG02_NODE_26189_length_638_cov_1.714286_1_plen_165_part_00
MAHAVNPALYERVHRKLKKLERSGEEDDHSISSGDGSDSEVEEDEGELSGLAELAELDSIRQSRTPGASREEGGSSSEEATSGSSDEDESAPSSEDGSADISKQDLTDSLGEALASKDVDAVRSALEKYSDAPQEVQDAGVSRALLTFASISAISIAILIHEPC